MAAIKIPDSDSHTQGLIKYLKDTSQCSRDNIFLRELGSAANFKHQLHALLDGWIRAEARSMLVQWIEADNGGDHRPTKIRGLQKLPSRTSDFGPFFGDREKSSTIRRSQTVSEQKQWSLYYEAWGCLVCQRRDVPHASNGMCQNCRMRTYGRLKRLTAPR